MKTFEFQGKLLAFRAAGDDWFVTAREVAEALGYRDHRDVIRLHARHEAEFKPGESTVVNLPTVDGKARDVRVFSPKGVMRLALHANTPPAGAFRDFALEVLEDLRSGKKVIAEAPAAAGLLAELASLRDKVGTMDAVLGILALNDARTTEACASHLARRRYTLAAQENARLALAEGQLLLVPGATPLPLGDPRRRKTARLTDAEVGRLLAVWREHVGEADRTVAQLRSVPALRVALERLGGTAAQVGTALMEIAGRVVGGSAVERVVTRGRGAWRIRRWGEERPPVLVTVQV